MWAACSSPSHTSPPPLPHAHTRNRQNKPNATAPLCAHSLSPHLTLSLVAILPLRDHRCASVLKLHGSADSSPVKDLLAQQPSCLQPPPAVRASSTLSDLYVYIFHGSCLTSNISEGVRFRFYRSIAAREIRSPRRRTTPCRYQGHHHPFSPLPI